MIAAVADMVEFGEATAGELSVNNLSGKTKTMHGKGLLDVILYKQELLHHFLHPFIDTRAIPKDEEALAKTVSVLMEPEPKFLRFAINCEHMRTRATPLRRHWSRIAIIRNHSLSTADRTPNTRRYLRCH